ncbi:MAG: hypothetical protein AAFV80_08760 [Bacteroidota bacterium]
MKKLILLTVLLCVALVSFGQPKVFKNSKLQKLNLKIQQTANISPDFKQVAQDVFVHISAEEEEGEDPGEPTEPDEPKEPEEPEDPEDDDEEGDCIPASCPGMIDPWTCECYTDMKDPFEVKAISQRMEGFRQLERMALNGKGGNIISANNVQTARQQHPGKGLKAVYNRMQYYATNAGF